MRKCFKCGQVYGDDDARCAYGHAGLTRLDGLRTWRRLRRLWDWLQRMVWASTRRLLDW